MVQILGVLLTIIAATGLVFIWDWMVGAYTYARARLRPQASPHAKAEDDEDNDEEWFI